MHAGTLQSLWRWPVKSMSGEHVGAVSVGPHGVGGDRAHAITHEHKGERRHLTAREAPRLLAWTAAYPFNLGAGLDPGRPPHALVSDPDGRRTWRWGDPRLRSALERDLGRPVELVRDVAGMPDVPGQVLITTRATHEALERELESAIDVRRFRPNFHLELDAPAWAELGWPGATVAFEHGVRLEVVDACERCAIPTRDPDTQEKWPQLLSHLAAQHGQNLGVLARVLSGGRVAEGELVRVETSNASGSGDDGR
jgi:uncharacterized protein YcbX